MALNDGDKAECKEIAREIIKEVLAEHIKSCPHGIKMGKIWMLFVGAGAGGGIGISELIRHFFS
jgi:hypothetical protein